MAKDPAFLFYPGDFITGTQFFSDEQVGKYIRLLLAQHQLGHLEEKHMIMICKSYDKDVFSKFSKDSEGKYFNERLENEIIKRRNYSESRSKNKTGKKIISKSYDLHMENRNRDINTITNNNIVNQFFKDFENGSHIIEMSRIQKTTIEVLKIKLNEFRAIASTEYVSYGKFIDHFRNWYLKNKEVKQQNNGSPIKLGRR